MKHALDKCALCGHLRRDHRDVCWGANPPDSGCCGCPGFAEPAVTQDFNKGAYETLLTYEAHYLKTNGWERGSDGTWSNEILRREGLVHGHAVNVQKQRDQMSAAELASSHVN